MMANFVMNTSLACLPSLRLQEMILARTMMTLSAVLTIVLSMQHQRQHNTLCPRGRDIAMLHRHGQVPGQLGPTRGNFLLGSFFVQSRRGYRGYSQDIGAGSSIISLVLENEWSQEVEIFCRPASIHLHASHHITVTSNLHNPGGYRYVQICVDMSRYVQQSGLVSVSSVSGDECQIKSVTNVVTLLLPHPSQHLVLTPPAPSQ